ncbi:T9SS type A sorting domain-containing protein [Bacteroidota bacterium]
MKRISLIIIFLLHTVVCFADGDPKRNNRQIMINPSYAIFNINNISTVIQNNGQSDHYARFPNGGWRGYNFLFPKEKKLSMIYSGGFVFGGKVNGEIRVGGAHLGSGLTPGKILNDGSAQDSYHNSVRAYRVRPDYKNCSLHSEVNDGLGTEDEIRNKYELDWNEWPANDSAPFDDKNKNGLYEPDIDIPGIPGADQTIWYVANDFDEQTTKEYLGSLPMGMEVQVTVWGYNYPGPLSNMMFRKYVLINKGSDHLTDMHFGVWSDPDVGSPYDDYVGCDTTLNMGFVYNDGPYEERYGDTPPSLGFQLLQGPIVQGNAGDLAKAFGNQFQGKKNLDMTAIGYLFRSNTLEFGGTWHGEYERGTLVMYNYLQGKNKLGDYIPIPDTLGGGTTSLPFAGDPITQTGYLDGMLVRQYDRRLMVCSGPFEMKPGDRQEIIYSFIAAGAFEGCSNMGSLGLLKHYAEYAEFMYDHNFSKPPEPKSPTVTASTFSREVILMWDDKSEEATTDNIYSGEEFSFQGYNVYQFPNQNSNIEEAYLIETQDKIDGIKNVAIKTAELESGYPTMKVKANGNDTGLNRYTRITKDYFTNHLMNDGTNYYFGVTAYCILYKDGTAFDLIESEPQILKIMPEPEKPGVRYEGEFGEEVEVQHSEGYSAGKINVNIINPSLLTGHDYEITFTDELPFNNNWNVTDVTTNTLLIGSMPFSENEQDRVIVDGFAISVENVEREFGTDYPYYRVQHVASGENHYWEPVWNNPLNENIDTDIYYVSSGSGREEDAVINIEYGVPRDFELRFTDGGGYAVYAFEDNRIARVPFELWDINYESPWHDEDDVRMIPVLLSNDDSTKSFWGWNTGVNKLGLTDYPASDRIYWAYPEDMSFGSEGYNKFAEHCELSGGTGSIYDLSTDLSEYGYYANLFDENWKFPISDITICDYDRDGNYPPSSTVIRFYTPRPFFYDDAYTFTVPDVTVDKELELNDVDNINVFPNPYYGGHANELNQYHNYVMFNHLPQRATFRIFNLAGHLVRTLHKDDDTQFYLWDLQNENRLLAPSGLYIIYIEMPDLQKVKVLKLAIVQREVVPGNF